MKIKSNLIIIFALLLFSYPVYSSSNTTPYQFLRYNYSARAAGLAGCFEAMPDDPSALTFNPATISTVEEKNFSTTFLKHVLDINSGAVVLVFPEEWLSFEDGIFAASVSYTNYGSFEYADEFAVRDGRTFSANDVSLSATYSNELDSNFYYGVSTKLIFITLESYSSFAFAVDAGLMYRLKDNRTNIGLSVLNAGTQVTKIDMLSESLPLDIRFGINHRLEGLPLLVNASLHHLADNNDKFLDRFLNFSLGGELYLGKNIRVRLGYDNNIRRLTSPDNSKKYSGLTGGVGLQTDSFNLDYGLAQIGSSATLHRFSVYFKI